MKSKKVGLHELICIHCLTKIIVVPSTIKHKKHDCGGTIIVDQNYDFLFKFNQKRLTVTKTVNNKNSLTNIQTNIYQKKKYSLRTIETFV